MIATVKKASQEMPYVIAKTDGTFCAWSDCLDTALRYAEHLRQANPNTSFAVIDNTATLLKD